MYVYTLLYMYTYTHIYIYTIDVSFTFSKLFTFDSQFIVFPCLCYLSFFNVINLTIYIIICILPTDRILRLYIDAFYVHFITLKP